MDHQVEPSIVPLPTTPSDGHRAAESASFLLLDYPFDLLGRDVDPAFLVDDRVVVVVLAGQLDCGVPLP